MKFKCKGLDITKMTTEDVIEALTVLDILLKSTTITNYSKVATDPSFEINDHICVSGWLNSLNAFGKKEVIDRILKVARFAWKFGYNCERMSDEDFAKVLKPIVEAVKKKVEEDERN